MSQGVEQRLTELAKAYATNRRELHANSQAIKVCSEDGYVDLTKMRDRYWGGQWCEDGECIKWHGWLHAVQKLYDHDGQALEEDDAHYVMAVLLDERKEIKRRANALKSRLRAIGDQLLRESN